MKTGRIVRASAPGKAIITGEHFVVHGAYALAAAIDRRVVVTVSKSSEFRGGAIVSGGKISKIDQDDHVFPAPKAVAKHLFSEMGLRNPEVLVEIESPIPAGSGLGSSAAVSVATAAALTKFLEYEADEAKLFEIAMAGEKKIHGSPSGIDIEASLIGGVILFSKGSGTKSIRLARPVKLLVAYSGRQRNTSELIRRASMQKKAYPATWEKLALSASTFSLQAAAALANSDLPQLGAIMNMMQAALCWIGVSNPRLETMIELALSKDCSHGAKITGAGGGGCIIALPRQGRSKQLLRQMVRDYPQSFLCTIPQVGLRWGS